MPRRRDAVVVAVRASPAQVNALKKVPWRFLIIDEAHRIKNEASLFARTARSLRAERRLLVTGTPLQNNLHELWALLNFLHPAAFPDVGPFAAAYDLGRGVVDRDMLVRAQVVLGTLMLRRLKVDVETGLPTEGVLLEDLDVPGAVLCPQLDDAGVASVVGVLRKARSTYLEPFSELRGEVAKELAAAEARKKAKKDE